MTDEYRISTGNSEDQAGHSQQHCTLHTDSVEYSAADYTTTILTQYSTYFNISLSPHLIHLQVVSPKFYTPLKD